MRFLSNFGCKIVFMCSVNFCHQQDYNSLFKGGIGHLTILVQEAIAQITAQKYKQRNHLKRKENDLDGKVFYFDGKGVYFDETAIVESLIYKAAWFVNSRMPT